MQATCCLLWLALFQRLMLPRGLNAEPTVYAGGKNNPPSHTAPSTFSLVSAVSRPTLAAIVPVPLRVFLCLEATHEQGHLFVWLSARLSFLAGVMSAVSVPPFVPILLTVGVLAPPFFVAEWHIPLFSGCTSLGSKKLLMLLWQKP